MPETLPPAAEPPMTSSPPAPAAAAAAPKRLLMRHPASGRECHAPIGYAWPVLLFGPLAMARRRDWSGALVCLVLPLAGQILMAPRANRRHLRRLIAQGYRAVSTAPGRVSHAEWLLGMQIPRYSSRRAPPGTVS